MTENKTNNTTENKEKKKEFFLVLESIPEDDVVKSAKIRSIFLTEFGYNIEQAREILDNLPHAIAISDDLNTLENIAKALYGTDAELNIIPVLEDEDLAEASAQEEKKELNKRIHREFHPEKFLSKRAVTKGNLSIVNISPGEVEFQKTFYNSPLFVNTLTSVIITIIVLGFSYIAFYEAPQQDPAAANIKDKITRIQEDLELSQANSDSIDIKVEKPKIFVANFEIDNIAFEINLSIFNEKIKSFNLEALPVSPETKPDGFEKATLTSINFQKSSIEEFIIQGTLKLYMTYRNEIQRPTANVYINGKYQAETNGYQLRLLVNRGFQELPDANQVKLVNSDLELTKIFIDKKINLKLTARE